MTSQENIKFTSNFEGDRLMKGVCDYRVFLKTVPSAQLPVYCGIDYQRAYTKGTDFMKPVVILPLFNFKFFYDKPHIYIFSFDVFSNTNVGIKIVGKNNFFRIRPCLQLIRFFFTPSLMRTLNPYRVSICTESTRSLAAESAWKKYSPFIIQ